jgi:hypothetical protein
MGILWIIVIGFVAGVIARLLAPGPNKPAGFLLTDGAWHRRRLRGDLHRPSRRMVPPRPGRGLHRRDPGRHRGPVRVEPDCRFSGSTLVAATAAKSRSNGPSRAHPGLSLVDQRGREVGRCHQCLPCGILLVAAFAACQSCRTSPAALSGRKVWSAVTMIGTRGLPRARAWRARAAAAMLARPSAGVGPDDLPPCSLQRQAPRFVSMALHWQGVPRRVAAPQRILRRVFATGIVAPPEAISKSPWRASARVGAC